MLECFTPKKFRRDTQDVIDQANRIISQYQAQGFSLTLRQLYYQFVARDLIANKQSEYKRLGSIINDARLAGEIDWDAIEDRTRNLAKLADWENPQSILNGCAQQYKEDRWEDQDYYVEVWIEKEALVGVIERVCDRNRVPYLACRGYLSQSETYAALARFRAASESGRQPMILHLGDHDPSGIDMTRDNADRLEMMMENGDGFYEHLVEVRRLALNMDQVRTYNPPPNPAKETDIRIEGYRAKYGNSSWELDALEPSVIAELIQDAVDDVRDMTKWRAAEKREADNRALLRDCSTRWQAVKAFLAGDPSEED